MKLKHLLTTKFLNKYHSLGHRVDGLESFIDEQLSQMFTGDKFDERNLVKIDRRVRMFIKQQASSKPSSKIGGSNAPSLDQ